MKQNILPALRLTLFCMVFFMGIYTLVVLAAAQILPDKGKGMAVMVNGQEKGWKLIGQKFTDDRYFWSRPSAVDYNAAGAGGSNKGPSNPDYLQQVQGRIDSFLVHNPDVKREEVPADLVTASGSGLDPDISVPGAYVQVKRIAKIRNLPVEKVQELVKKNITAPFMGLFGTERVNVLQLNIDLDAAK